VNVNNGAATVRLLDSPAMSLPTIDSVPEGVTAAGQAHGYPDPPAFVTIDLVNIPADPDHQNAGSNQAAYDTFIDAQIAATGDPTIPGGAAWTVVDQVMYDPEYSPKLEIDYDTAVRLYNYGRVTFPGGRRWYVFYTPVYLNPNTTLFRADIDEFPSFTWGLGYSMVDRGHYAVAASQGDTYGNEFLTAPEPIDAPPARGVLSAPLLGSAPNDWTVLVISANDLRGDESGDEKFWELHINNGSIQTAADLASAATVDSAGEVQTTIEEPAYPWSIPSPGSPPTGLGPPVNGFVPDDMLGGIDGASVRAELETVIHFDLAQASYPDIHITPAASGAPESPSAYWDRALDIAIHADPALYGVTDPDLSPIGESLHGLGIRINVTGSQITHLTEFGFTEFNPYTYTYAGPYTWALPITDTTQVFVPQVVESPVSTIDGVPAGGGCYTFTMSGFAEYLTIMQGAKWVLDGIVDIRLVPGWALSGGGDHVFTAAKPSRDPSDPSWAVASAIPVFADAVVSATATPTVLANWRASALSAVGVSAMWGKLLTAQFTDLLVGNGDGTKSFKPDQWETPDIEFEAVTGAAHGDPSIRLIPTGYNDLGSQMGIDSPVGGVPGVARSGFSSAAANTAQADMGPFLAGYSNDASWQVQFRQRELAQILGIENAQMSLGAAGVNAIFGGGGAAAGGAAQGLAAIGGAAGAIGGAVAGAASAPASLMQAAIQASNAITLLAVNTDGSFDIGAYQLGISGQSAVLTFSTWWQSLDATSGSGSGDRLASAWRAIIGQAFDVIIAMPTAERIKALISEWSRYGYMIGQAFTPARLDAMTKFTYWKTTGALITGSTPQEKRQTIAEAFDRGVTLWNDLADIGTDVTGANAPITGITY
jgi:hypothetical protein